MAPRKKMAKAKVLHVVHHQAGRGGQRGEGFFGDVWNGFKSVVNPVANFVKDNKLISRGLGMVGDPRAKVAGSFLSQLGLGYPERIPKGRKRRVMVRV
jgi:hypothetical protein